MSQETIVTLRGENNVYKIKNVKNGVLTRNILMDAIPETKNLFPNLIDIKIGRNVNKINDHCFDNFIPCTLRTITIPDTVTEIGLRAFHKNQDLTSITIPNSVTFIGNGAFLNCVNLKNIKLSNNLETINEALFQGCENLENIVISNSVKIIQLYAFKGCKKLNKLVINNNEIVLNGFYTFQNCINLKSLYLPSGARFINYRHYPVPITFRRSSIQKLYTIRNNKLNIKEGKQYVGGINLEVIFVSYAQFYFNDSKTIIERPIYDNILTRDIVI